MGVRIEPQVRMLGNRPRASGRYGILIAVCAPVALSTSSPAQTLEEVKQAVEAYFGPDVESVPARKSLARWGNGALMHLRSLSDRSSRYQTGKYGHALVCAAGTIRTKEAIDFLVDVLDGKSAIRSSHALSQLRLLVSVENSEEQAQLKSHPRFKSAVRRFATSQSSLNRVYVAEIAATLKWMDFEPLIAAMLEDKNVNLRKAAASAIFELTGERVDPRTPATEFTSERLIPDLLGAPVLLSGGHAGNVRESFFLTRGNGTALMTGDASSFVSYPLSEGALKLSFSLPAIDVFSLECHGAPAQLIALTVESGFSGAGAEYAIAWSEAGQELWRYVPPRRGLDLAVVLYDREGPYGVAFGPGGESGIVAIDARGEQLWDLPRIYALGDLSTHPRLPNLLLGVSGEFFLVEHSTERIDCKPESGWPQDRPNHQIYGYSVLLFPGVDGSPQLVVSGSGDHSTAVMASFNQAYERQWTVSLSSFAFDLELLEVDGREPVLVFTTQDCRLFLIDRTGTLLWQGALPWADSGKQCTVFELKVGTYSPGKAAVAVDGPQGYFLYPVNAEALPLAR